MIALNIPVSSEGETPAAADQPARDAGPNARPQQKSRRSGAVHRPKPNSVQRARRVKRQSGTKQDKIIALLRRDQGVTLAALAKATGWQPHSVRGFLAGTVRKKLKLRLSSKLVDGRRLYRIPSGRAASGN